MRLSIYIITLFLLSSVNISAQFLLAEDFSGHDIGDPVENAINNAEPIVGEWIAVESLAGSTVPIVINEQLSFSDYVYSERGKTMYTLPTDGVRNIVFCLSTTSLPYPCQPEGGFIDGSNEFYTAFLLDLSQTTADETQEIFSYYQLGSDVRRGSLFYKLSSDKRSVSFSFQKNPELSSSSWTKNYDKSKVFLIVVKYSHVCINEKNLGHSEFELFINPIPKKTEEENATLRVSAFGNNKGYDTDLRYINFRQSGQTTMKVSGIRIGNSFEKVLLGEDDTSINKFENTDLLFYVENKSLLPNKVLNGKLSIYDLSTTLLSSCNVYGKNSIEMNFEPGVYILLYEEGGSKYVQKVLIQ